MKCSIIQINNNNNSIIIGIIKKIVQLSYHQNLTLTVIVTYQLHIGYIFIYKHIDANYNTISNFVIISNILQFIFLLLRHIIILTILKHFNVVN